MAHRHASPAPMASSIVAEYDGRWLSDDADDRRHIFAGANWSPGLKNPFRSFGHTGEGLESMLREQRVGGREPIVFMLHLAHPRVEYTDRAKSAIVVADGGDEE